MTMPSSLVDSPVVVTQGQGQRGQQSGGGQGGSEGCRPVVHLVLSFRQLCLVTVCLPLCALVLCFVTAYIFQPDEIHETHCRVYNIIPSISAITGVSPQRYLWRICVAFHIGPRFLIASVYRSYYSTLMDSLPLAAGAPQSATATSGNSGGTSSYLWQRPPVAPMSGTRLLTICYWLNIIEIGALCGVTYISNKENYPVHEKIFILFMLCSLSHMLATLKVFKLCHPVMAEDERASYLVKKFLFVTSIISTVGLLLFFAKHRLLCHDMAFSWFALCEYVIACANMAFHVSVVLDFPKEELIVAKGLGLQTAPTNNRKAK